VLLRQYHDFLREAETAASAVNLQQVKAMRAGLEKAQRFVFSESAAMACRQLAEHPDQLRRAQSQIFAPFPQCWIEFPPGDTETGARVSEGFFWAGEGDGLRRGGFIYVGWPRGVEFPTLIPTLVDLDQTEPIHMPQAALSMLIGAQDSAARDRAITPGEAAAAVPEMLRWMLAAWALLASKGMTGSVIPDLSRLNRSRGQRGLYPLLAYTEIRLNLDAEAAVRAKSAVGTGHMPLHPVRAHLRLLHTGRVVIVRAHMRGNPEHGIKSHHYSVVRAEDVL